jgi:S-adenosylmethionine hydrolase
MAIIGSRQTLEIAVNQGCARDHFKIEVGSTVTVHRARGAGGEG